MGDKMKPLKRLNEASAEEPHRKRVHFPAEDDLSDSSTYIPSDSSSYIPSDSSSYIPSESSSTSSAVSATLTTITRDINDNDLVRIYWPSKQDWYRCSYQSMMLPSCDLTPAMLLAITAAKSVHLEDEENYQSSCPLFAHRIDDYAEYVGRGYQWHNGNGKGYFSTLFKLLLNGTANSPTQYLIDKTCGKTKHERGFSQIYIRKDDNNEKYDTTTDAFIFIKHLRQYVVVVEVKMDAISIDGTRYGGYRQKYTGQLEREVIGLWEERQKCCIGVLCQKGQVMIYKFVRNQSTKTVNISYSEFFNLCEQQSFAKFCKVFLLLFKSEFI